MPTIEGFRLNFRNRLLIPLTCKVRGKRLKNKNFTIISNNCWGGTVYEAHNLPKESPTVGMFFMADDYIRFLSDLRGFLGGVLSFIPPMESKWRDAPQVSGDSRFGSYPVGVLSNGTESVEIFFLHYHSEQEAKEKWERRCKRVNWERMLVKFNDQNGCTSKNVQDFMKLPFRNKLFFTCREWPEVHGGVYCLRQFPKHEFIMASFEPFGKSKYIDITGLLNEL